MTETIRVNGVDMPLDQLEGVSGEELTSSYRSYNANRMHAMQGGPQGTYGGGIPRHRKHKGDAVLGVRFK